MQRKLDKDLVRFHADRIHAAAMKMMNIMYGRSDEKKVDALKAAFDKLVKAYWEIKPVMDREIIDNYPAAYNPQIATLILEGVETGRNDDYMPPMTMCNPERAAELVSAVYEDVCEELVVNLRAEGDEAKHNAEYLENWIRSDPYGLLTDPDAVIGACHQRAERR